MGKQATPSKFRDNQSGATAKFLRVPPRKARLVINAVRGKYVSDALAILKFVPNFAARAIEDVIQSAVANAESGRPNAEATGKPMNPLITENLRLVRAFVDEGPRIKRLQPRAQGRAYRILKRMCHISVIVEEVAPKPRKIAKPKVRKTQAATPKSTSKPATKKAVEETKTAVAEPEIIKPAVEVEEIAQVVEEIAPVATTAAEAEAAQVDEVVEEPTAEALAKDTAAEAIEEAKTHETAAEEPKAE
jgi:large subunit ribosomal protein L22